MQEMNTPAQWKISQGISCSVNSLLLSKLITMLCTVWDVVAMEGVVFEIVVRNIKNIILQWTEFLCNDIMAYVNCGRIVESYQTICDQACITQVKQQPNNMSASSQKSQLKIPSKKSPCTSYRTGDLCIKISCVWGLIHSFLD